MSRRFISSLIKLEQQTINHDKVSTFGNFIRPFAKMGGIFTTFLQFAILCAAGILNS